MKFAAGAVSGVLAFAMVGCPSAGNPGDAKQGGQTQAPKPATSDVTAEDYAAPPLRKGYVTLPDAFGTRHRLEVELADQPASRTRGLMWRRDLADDKGMLFIFPTEEVQAFWMKNTLIPLDMLFINQAHQVVGIVEQAGPRTLISRTVGLPSMYVLEVAGGWAARMGVRPGVTASFEVR